MGAVNALLNSEWALWALCALAAALLAWHFTAGLLAMRPARGTLEWIRAQDAPAFTLAMPCALSAADVTPMLIAAGVTLIFRGFGSILTIRAAGAQGPEAARYVLLLLLSPLAASLAGYCLAKRFSGGLFAPLMCALLLSLNTGDAYALPFLALAALFCLGHADGFSGAAWLASAAGGACLAVAAYFRPACWYFGAALWLVLLADAALGLFAPPERRIRHLAAAALLFPVFAAAFWLLANLPGAAFAGIPAFGAAFLPWLLARLTGGLTLSFPTPSISLSQLAILIYAVPAAAFCLIDFRRTREFRAPAAAWLLAAAVAVLLLTGLDALVLGCLPACGYLWSRRLARGGRAAVCVAAGLLLAVSAFLCVFSWLSLL